MPDSEKITINMSAVDLGKVDLLVQEGVYSNRTDFIRTAIRSQIEKHNFEVQQSVVRHSYGVGAFAYTRGELEAVRAKGQKLKISVVGLLNLSDDVSVELAQAAIESIQVRGVFHARDELKQAMADRTR
jgi:Arc/MetJ-type ribon-helix-helix transcriptional regulator